MNLEPFGNWIIFEEVDAKEQTTKTGIIMVPPGTNVTNPREMAEVPVISGRVLIAGPDSTVEKDDEFIFEPIPGQMLPILHEGKRVIAMRSHYIIAKVLVDLTDPSVN